MTQHPNTCSAADVRAQLAHPVIDFDGHMLEFLPELLDVIRDVAGAGIAERLFPMSVTGASGAMKRQSSPPSG
jgi:hypothetical protein